MKDACPSASNQLTIGQVNHDIRCLLNWRPECPICAEDLHRKGVSDPTPRPRLDGWNHVIILPMPLDALAFGAHPDDVELACSGTLIKLASQGYETGVIALTRGELSTRGSLEIRADEFDRAAKAMRVSAHKILDIPDGFIESSRSQKLKVIREIRTHRPRIVLAPYWADRHPDHANASVLVREAAFLAGLERIETNQDAFRPYRVVFYPCRYEFKPSFIVDISGFHDQKLRAIQAYESQFDHPEKNRFGDQETNISRPEFLEAVITRSKQYGSYIGTAFGEPFLVREPLRLDDPVEFFDSTYGGSLL